MDEADQIEIPDDSTKRDWPPPGWGIYGSRSGERAIKRELAPRPASRASHPDFPGTSVDKLEQARQLLLGSEGKLEGRRRAHDLVLDAVGPDEQDPYLIIHAGFLMFDLGALKQATRYASRLSRTGLAVHPADAALLAYVIGRILQHVGQNAEAGEQFLAAMRLDPNERLYEAALADLRQTARPRPPETSDKEPRPTLPVRWTRSKPP